MFLSDYLFGFAIAILILVAVISQYFSPLYLLYNLMIGITGALLIPAWRWIAERRRGSLDLLMKRICPPLFKELEAICQVVPRNRRVQNNVLERSISQMEQFPRSFYVDRLYPRSAFDELRRLSRFVAEYDKDWTELDNAIRSKFGGEAGFAKEIVLGRKHIARATNMPGGWFEVLEARTHGSSQYVPGTLGDPLNRFKDECDRKSDYLRKCKDGTWTRELVERSGKICSILRGFLDQHAIVA